MNEELAVKNDAKLMESVLLGGDLSKLTPAQRVQYYQRVCESIGLNPLTKPFGYITLNGRLTLYALKDAADQLRRIHGVSIDDVDIHETDTQFIVKVKGHDSTGRTDVEVGVVNKSDMRGDTANAQMKAVTKSKRRLTLSICGLGWLDETEVQTIPDARPVVIADNGDIIEEPKPMPYEEAIKVKAKNKKGEEVTLDTLNSSQLQYLVENSKDNNQVEAAFTILEHDHNMPRPGSR